MEKISAKHCLGEDTSLMEENSSLLEEDTLNNYHEAQLKKIGFGFIQIVIVIFNCLGWIASHTGLMVMIILPDFLACEWKLEVHDITMMTICHCVGASLGSIIFGITFDKVSKIHSISVGCFLMTSFTFGIWFTNSNNKILFDVCLFFVGFGLGAIWSLDSYLADFVTFDRIGWLISFTHMAGTISNILIPLSAEFIFFSIGWKTWILMIAILYLIIFTLSLFLPESPKQYLYAQKKESYLSAMKNLGKYNKIHLDDDFCTDETILTENNSHVDGELISRKIKFGIFILFIVYLLDSAIFFALKLQNNKIEHVCVDHHIKTNTIENLYQNKILNMSTEYSNQSHCTPLTKYDIQHQVISGIGGIVGSVVITLVVDFTGRKKLLIYPCIVFLVLNLMFLMCLPYWLNSILILILRGISFSLYTVLSVYATEFLPFSIRTICLGIGGYLGMLGFISGSFLVEYLSLIRPEAMTIGISVLSALFVISVLFLKETKP